MKTGALFAILLIGLAGAAGSIWLWRNWSTPGSASDHRATLSRNDITFLVAAHSFLQAQLAADEQASTHGHFELVRTFASRMAGDHRNEGQHVMELAASLAPELNLELTTTADSKAQGAAFDREYLNVFIENHEQRVETLRLALPPAENRELARFAASWTEMLNRHAVEARMVRDGLPRVASNMPLLLLIGVFSIASASLLEIRSRLYQRR